MTTETTNVPDLYQNMLRGWQQTVDTMISANREGWQRWLAATPFGVDERTSTLGTRGAELVQAQAAVAVEWLLTPWWLPGSNALDRFQQGYQRVFDAQRAYSEAWIDALTGWQRQQADGLEQAVHQTRLAVEREERTLRDLAEETEAGNDAVLEAAIDVAEAAEQAILPIKGNSSGGEKIFHVPGQSSYEQTQGQEQFATQSDAIAAGYRISRAPGGPAIKGNIGRDGERIYHMPGQANYDRVEAEALFETEAQAQAEGFRPAGR
jgi:hypothetical protein